jgi:predicted permease
VIAGGGFGLLAGRWVMPLLVTLIPGQLQGRMPYLDGLGLNLHVLVFAGTVMLLGILLFSLTPMVRLPASEILSGMVQASRGSSGVVWRRAASRLVAVELATAVILLTGAGLLGKSFYLLLKVDIGLEPHHLATLNISAPGSNYLNDPKRLALQREVMSSVAALPGVESVGLAGQLPVSHNGNTIWFRVVGQPFHGEHNDTPERQVSTGYFETVKAKLLKGRLFAETDDASRPPVVIVNRAMQRRYFGGEDAVGQRILYLFDGSKPKEVIGVVDDIKEGPLDTQTPPVIYVPFNEAPRADFVVIARAGQAEESLLPAMAAAIRQIDPGIVTSGGSSMSERINNAQSTYLHRSSAWLVGGFAGTALLLGVIGLYGMMAYSVNQRRREIGIRMALGARRDTVYKLVLKEAAQVTAIGAVTGLVLSIALAAMIRKMLFGTPPWDALTLASVTTLLTIASLLASYLPLRRAASVDPVEVLRAE